MLFDCTQAMMFILVFCYAFIDVNRSWHESGCEIWHAESRLVFICLLVHGLWSFWGVQGLGGAEAMLVSMGHVVAQFMQGCRISDPHCIRLSMLIIIVYYAMLSLTQGSAFNITWYHNSACISQCCHLHWSYPYPQICLLLVIVCVLAWDPAS